MDVALTGGHILGQISTKLCMMVGGRMGMVTVSGRHGPVITAVTVGLFLAKLVVGTHSRSHFRSDLHQT